MAGLCRLPKGVTLADIGTYRVRSRSKRGDAYLVDVRERTCTCDRFLHDKEGPLTTCYHLELVLAWILNQDGHTSNKARADFRNILQ